MSKRFFLLLILFAAYAPLMLAGAIDDYHFINFTSNNSNLSYNGVQTIFQDSRGYVWVGTYKGLNRWDGERFKSYSKAELHLESDFVSEIFEDSNGSVWIGTDRGICVYDYYSDSFSSLESINSSDIKIEEKVFSIKEDSSKNIWIGVRSQGLHRYNLDNHLLERIPLTLEGKDISDLIFLLEFDKADNLFIYEYCDNIYTLSKNGDVGVLVESNPSYFAGDDIGGMVFNNGYLYIASKRHGLCEVNPRSGKISELYSIPLSHRPVGLFCASGRELWMCTTYSLLEYDILTHRVKQYTNDPKDLFSLSDNSITSVIVDRKGGIWAGTLHNGVNYHCPENDFFKKYYQTSDGHSLMGVMIRSVCEDDDQIVWIATETLGLLRFFPGSGLLTRYDSDAIPKNLTSVFSEGKYIWVGSQNGIYRLNPSNGEVKTYSELGDGSFEGDNRVITLFISSSGSLYAGTTVGVMKYDSSTDKFSIVPYLDNLVVENIGEDTYGNIWFASYSSGAVSYDPSTETILGRYPLSGMTSSICIDGDDNIWVIGFSDGLFKYDIGSDSFVNISTYNQPSLPTDVFFKALPDDYGNLWISSDRGLVEYNAKVGSIKVFSTEDGLLDNEFQKSATRLSDGTMLFGSRNGFILFNPDDLQNESGMVRMAITDFQIAGESCSPLTNGGTNINLASKIVFSPTQSSFGFNFSTLDWTSISYGHLLCKLDGYDSEWREVQADKSVNFFNVPAGTYVLKLAVANSDGTIYPGHSDLEIIVEPKFWQSTLGLILILLICASGAGLIFLIFYERAITEQKEKQVRYEKERDQELYNEKMSFFSNIIHEIKTPLTLIQTPLSNIRAKESELLDIQEDLRTIGNSTEYMDHLVKELLEFVRVEKYGYELVFKTVDIVEKVGFMCFNFAETAKAKNINFKYRHDEDCIYTEADESALNKMLSNLLLNAVKYAESYIDVHVYQDNGKVSVSIRNDGVPIPEEHRNDIFKPFVQFSGSASPYSQSFGIGLSLSKTFAEMHNGELFLDTDDSCTKFVLRMPARVDKTIKYVSPVENIEDYLKSSSEPLVVIVEDNKDLLEYLRSKLSLQFRVLAVPSAEQGLALMKRYPVDVLITDIALQNMSGVELCRKVTTDFNISHIPIIVMSAISSVETKITCMEAGANIYIEKPFNMEYLLSCIKGILEKRKQMRSRFNSDQSDNFNAEQFELPNADVEFLRRLESVVNANLMNPEFSNKQMEELLFLSHSTLNRKVKSMLDTTPNDYLRERRLSVAAHLLENGENRVNEICYAVGFSSPSYFSKCFKNEYGVLPAEYRQRFKADK